MGNFDINAIIRGMQLTVVGANRALLNPQLFRHVHFQQALLAVVAGLAIHLVLMIPVLFAKASIYATTLFASTEHAPPNWDKEVLATVDFLQHSVLQLPFFLMNFMKFLSPALDNMFMESLKWVDDTYATKHKSEDPKTLRAGYYDNLKQYYSDQAPVTKSRKVSPWQGIDVFLTRYGKKAVLTISVYIFSHIPYVGKFILPLLSFYTFDKAVGNKPAVLIFASGLVLPKKYLIQFLQIYFGSRSMTRELLEPYFSRVHFSSQQKKRFFFEREGVLFGFGLAFFLLIRIPIFGVLVYGIAEASTAFLITKITDPPPPPEGDSGSNNAFVEDQTEWHQKKDVLQAALTHLDKVNMRTSSKGENLLSTELPRKKFT